MAGTGFVFPGTVVGEPFEAMENPETPGIVVALGGGPTLGALIIAEAPDVPTREDAAGCCDGDGL